jgi:hypothetical protein
VTEYALTFPSPLCMHILMGWDGIVMLGMRRSD